MKLRNKRDPRHKAPTRATLPTDLIELQNWVPRGAEEERELRWWKESLPENASDEVRKLAGSDSTKVAVVVPRALLMRFIAEFDAMREDRDHQLAQRVATAPTLKEEEETRAHLAFNRRAWLRAICGLIPWERMDAAERAECIELGMVDAEGNLLEFDFKGHRLKAFWAIGPTGIFQEAA